MQATAAIAAIAALAGGSAPDHWHGRFLYLGGGGNDGVIRDTTLSSPVSLGTPSPL